MKKYVLILFFAAPFLLLAQQKADSVKLKNGKVVAGYIYKMDDGKIYIAATADSTVFTAGEVQTIMFCHSSQHNSKALVSVTDANKGTVNFSCSDCSEKGTLKITGPATAASSSCNYSFTNDKGKSNLFYTLQLLPGEYNWTYTGAGKNETTGKFTVNKNEERNILLRAVR